MKTQNRYHFTGAWLMLILLLSSTIPAIAAPPAAPVPVSPTNGATIVIPTFSWKASSGAALYEVEIGPQSNLNLVYWSDQTANLSITPNDSYDFKNEPLYWRVRAYDSSYAPGAWSARINFTKQIPAVTLVGPANGSSVPEPVLDWQAVNGAVKYKVELSTVSTFLPVAETYTTYNTNLTPVQAIEHTTYYWRVTGVDTSDHPGNPSATWSFIKNSPAPTLVSPANGSACVEPVLRWQGVNGAAYYKVELSTASNFLPVAHTYNTYNTSLTPVQAIDNTTYYWRVRGVDAQDNAGAPSTGWSFVKNIPGPVLASPADGANVNQPKLAWNAAAGAANYKVELSTNASFTPVDYTYTTYNTGLTPVAALPLKTYYWRVSGMDAQNHVGAASTARSFTLSAPPAPVDATPQLVSPADAAVVATDPTFQWTFVVGAHDYRLKVDDNSSFSSLYDTVYTHNVSYTPYTASTLDSYKDGTYYWKIEARNSGGTVIATSAIRSFTRQTSLPLTSPSHAANLTGDPAFQWGRVVGAEDYRVKVSRDPSMSPLYDSVYTDYVSYTPYKGSPAAGLENTYLNGLYYWMVDARNSTGTVIASSAIQSFTKQIPVPLVSPNNAAVLTGDPTFQWGRVVGAEDYRVKISKDAGISPLFDSVYTDYVSFTPYMGTPLAGNQTAYPNGTYYWMVDARDKNGTVIASSAVRSLTRQMPLPLIAPGNGTSMEQDPNFQWTPVVGANSYQLMVSKTAGFATLYDAVDTDYPAFTPYNGSVGQYKNYENGLYYWRVQALDNYGVVIAVSNDWTFTRKIAAGKIIYLPIIKK